MILRALVFWLQTVSAPQIGYLDGFALYGVRGNFLLGAKLPDETISAAVVGGQRFRKLPTQICVNDDCRSAPPGPAIFSNAAAWLPGTAELGTWNGTGWRFTPLAELAGAVESLFVGGETLLAVVRREERLDLVALDAGTLALVRQEPLAAKFAAFDSNGRLWTADDKVRCGDAEWQILVSGLSTADGGWMLLSTPEAALAARCDSDETFVLPAL